MPLAVSGRGCPYYFARMADENKSTGSSGSSGKAQAQAEPEEPRYDRDVLIAESNPRLGVSSHTLVGALAKSTAKTFTLSRAKELLKEYDQREEEVAE